MSKFFYTTLLAGCTVILICINGCDRQESDNVLIGDWDIYYAGELVASQRLGADGSYGPIEGSLKTPDKGKAGEVENKIISLFETYGTWATDNPSSPSTLDFLPDGDAKNGILGVLQLVSADEFRLGTNYFGEGRPDSYDKALFKTLRKRR